MNTYFRTAWAIRIPAMIMIASSTSLGAASDTAPKNSAAPETKASPSAPKTNAAPAAAPAPQPKVAAAPIPSASESAAGMNATPFRLEEVEVSEARVSALTQAPTESALDTYQPQSVINLQFIANNLAPTADYSTIANLAPSVANVVTNGPGLSDARRATIRGFNDTQYNVTYDGIPFADTNDFSHHTTSYFPAKMIGRVIVERGPGTASTIGEATFGGTIALISKDPRSDMAFIPTVSYGSYGTFLGHIEANTGAIRGLNGASAIGSYQYMKTDGYQTNVEMKRDTTYVKYLQPVGSNTVVTFLSNYNSIKFNNPLPISQAQIDTLGRNFGLSSNPKDPLYFGYNHRNNKTDFEYIGVDSTLAKTWHFSNKTYTYYYKNGSFDTASIGNKAWDLGDNIGRFKLSSYRAWGDTAQLAWDNAFGTLKIGDWYEYERSRRFQYGLDYTKGQALDYNPALGSRTAYFYDLVNYLFTNQVFAEYDWRVSKSLTINAGVKEIYFKRKLDASINQTTRTPLYYSKKTSKPVESVAANYSIKNDWTIYGQVAQGFLAPNLNQFYVVNPNNNKIQPQETINYQAGTVYKKDSFNADLDVYTIDYRNFPHTTNDLSTGQSIVTMAKGAYFSGVEGQATYLMGAGTSFYMNGSINNAKYKKSKLDVDQVARRTVALGFLYDQNGFVGSLLGKYVGGSKVYFSALPTGFNPDDARSVTTTGISDGYWISDLAIGYGRKLSEHGLRSFKVRIEVNNLFDRKAQVLDSFSGAGVRLFDVLPRRNFFLTVSTEF